MAPVFICINNSLKNAELMHEVHKIFNCFKYSLFIPILIFVIKYIVPHISAISFMYQIYCCILDNCDYSYSNIVGPTVDNYKLSNIHFLTTAKQKECVFNIISTGDKINIIVTFKQNVVHDKDQFKSCISKAYESLVHAESTKIVT